MLFSACTRQPCEVRWRIADIDSRFGLSEYEVQTAAFNAANAWNEAAGHRVLRYDKEKGIPLRLVYDERHQTMTGGLAELAELRRLSTEIKNFKAQFDASPSQYAADRINRDVERYNALVKSFNARAGTDIEQGSFQSELEIYAFADLADLEMVIAHEMGHALGIGHVEAPGAVMSAKHMIGTTSTLQLTSADVAALNEAKPTSCAAFAAAAPRNRAAASVSLR